MIKNFFKGMFIFALIFIGISILALPLSIIAEFVGELYGEGAAALSMLLGVSFYAGIFYAIIEEDII